MNPNYLACRNRKSLVEVFIVTSSIVGFINVKLNLFTRRVFIINGARILLPSSLAYEIVWINIIATAIGAGIIWINRRKFPKKPDP